MALALGVNCGFCVAAPVTDPGGSGVTMDANAVSFKDTSPLTAATITEVGWWCDTATEESNFEVALYAADGAVVPGEAGTRLAHSATNAKGTTAGWKVVSGLSWAISASTAYWLAVQLDNTATTTNIDSATSGFAGIDLLAGVSTLPNPFGGGALLDSDGGLAIYAVWEAAAGDPEGNLTMGGKLMRGLLLRGGVLAPS